MSADLRTERRVLGDRCHADDAVGLVGVVDVVGVVLAHRRRVADTRGATGAGDGGTRTSRASGVGSCRSTTTRGGHRRRRRRRGCSRRRGLVVSGAHQGARSRRRMSFRAEPVDVGATLRARLGGMIRRRPIHAKLEAVKAGETRHLEKIYEEKACEYEAEAVY